MVPSSVGRPGLSMSGLSVMPAVADPITNLQVSTTWLLFLSTPYVKSWKIGTNKSCRPCTINRKYLISRRLCVLLLYKCKSKNGIKKLLQNLCSLMHQLPPLVAHFRSNLSARRTCLKARVQPSSTPNCSLIDASPILSFDILRHRFELVKNAPPNNYKKLTRVGSLRWDLVISRSRSSASDNPKRQPWRNRIDDCAVNVPNEDLLSHIARRTICLPLSFLYENMSPSEPIYSYFTLADSLQDVKAHIYFSNVKSNFLAMVYSSNNACPHAALISDHSTWESVRHQAASAEIIKIAYSDTCNSAESKPIDCTENTIMADIKRVIVHIRALKLLQNSGIVCVNSFKRCQFSCLLLCSQQVCIISSPESNGN